MRAGLLNRRVTFQRLVDYVDPEWGASKKVWQDVFIRIPAEVVDLLPSKDESVKNGVVFGVSKSRVRVRYRLGMDSSMRVVVHGSQDRIMQIIGGPAVVGNKEALEILCQEVSTNVFD